jgi:hypothetical protein
MFALAILGVFEFAHGFVGIGIFIAVSTETIIGFAYYRIWKKIMGLPNKPIMSLTFVRSDAAAIAPAPHI